MNDAAHIGKIYETLKARIDAAPTAIRELPASARAEYQREATRRSRAKARSSLEAGRPEASTGQIREVLADAALMCWLLADRVRMRSRNFSRRVSPVGRASHQRQR